MKKETKASKDLVLKFESFAGFPMKTLSFQPENMTTEFANKRLGKCILSPMYFQKKQVKDLRQVPSGSTVSVLPLDSIETRLTTKDKDGKKGMSGKDLVELVASLPNTYFAGSFPLSFYVHSIKPHDFDIFTDKKDEPRLREFFEQQPTMKIVKYAPETMGAGGMYASSHIHKIYQVLDDPSYTKTTEFRADGFRPLEIIVCDHHDMKTIFHFFQISCCKVWHDGVRFGMTQDAQKAIETRQVDLKFAHTFSSYGHLQRHLDRITKYTQRGFTFNLPGVVRVFRQIHENTVREEMNRHMEKFNYSTQCIGDYIYFFLKKPDCIEVGKTK